MKPLVGDDFVNYCIKFGKVMAYSIKQAIKHPNTNIVYKGNPMKTEPQSPVPWWVSLGILILGIATWFLSAHMGISELCEASRAMVYIPLGNIFGLTTKTIQSAKK